MDSLDDFWRHIRHWLVFGFGLRLSRSFGLRFIRFGFRLRLAIGFIFPKFPLCLLPVLNCCSTVGCSMFVEFVGPLGDLRSEIGRCFGLGRRLSIGLRLGYFCFCVSLGRLRISFSLGFC
jgi:hypothetical protein